MKSYELLNKAADLIEATGWTQGAFARDEYGNKTEPYVRSCNKGNGPVCFCASGAVLNVAQAVKSGKDDVASEQMWDAALLLLRAEVQGEIVSFNDAPGRTKEEVIEAMRRTADKWTPGHPAYYYK